MADTAQTIIEAAYLRSTANAPGKLATDQELINHLDRVHQGYCALLAVAAPERWVQSTTVAWTGTFPAPAITGALPTDIIDIHRIEDANGNEITLGPVAEKARAWTLTVPFVWRSAAQLMSQQRALDPKNGDTSTVWYLAAPATIATLSSTIDTRFPLRHEQLLILDLAIYLSLKDVEEDRKDEMDRLKSERDAHYAAFERLTGVVHTATQTVWPGRNRPATGAPSE